MGGRSRLWPGDARSLSTWRHATGRKSPPPCAHAHQRGIVHCDLKAANVIVTGDGTVKVLDFGIARRLTAQVADDMTQSLVTAERRGVGSGTLPYMPPERIRGGDADPRGDVWALGVVLFELLTGRRPFGGPTAADVSSAILQTPAPDLPSHVPKELRTIVERCLRKDAGERYQQASEVRAALETAAEAAAPPRRRRVAVVLAGIAALLAFVAAADWVVTRPPPAPTAIDSLAVLPFADLAPGPGSEYLADGVTDAMITELGQLGTLRVTARTSSLRYRDTSKPIPEIARELGVEAVLEGSIFRAGDRVRVTARLVRASTQSSIWTASYEREPRDMLALQRELARTVARELQITVAPASGAAATRAVAVDPAAYDAYLRGRYQWAKRTQASLLQSIELYQTAARLDPSYAAPHAGLAGTYVLLGLSGIVERPSREALQAAVASARRALELDPNLAEAHSALGYAQLWRWDLAASRQAFERAIELNPSDANTRFWNAIRLAAERRFDESIDEAKRGRQLDPVSPIVTAGVAWACHLAGRHEEAAEFAGLVQGLEPDFVIGLVRLGVAYRHLRAYNRAAEALTRAATVSQRNPDILAALGQTLGVERRSGEARAILTEIEAMSKSRYVPAYDRALVLAGLGDREAALDWLERARDERYSLMVLASIDPDLEALRDHPRFARLGATIVPEPGR